jgi:hypothetical protein
MPQDDFWAWHFEKKGIFFYPIGLSDACLESGGDVGLGGG